MRQIDENLKRVYKDVEEGEIPDRFKDLLDRLKEQDSNEK
ncbi:NepR family anti-sigma factor [Tranquillimonas rosea]|nr:NepR family anti-sigma factor [Tranquillimonas rosea]